MPPRSLRSLPPKGARPALGRPGGRPSVLDRRPRELPLPWPLPALAAWSLCWAAFVGLAGVGASEVVAFVVAGSIGAGLAVTGSTPWRRVFIGCGFPLSLAASGAAAALPAWAWLLPLAALALLYPVRAWRDAPLFPTPTGALAGLALRVPLEDGARVLDAGCGLGAGLRELHREYPAAALTGIEWSRPLRWVCAWRCGFARVCQGDLWAADWSRFDLVYVFQRPESMARVAAKAAREMPAGTWLASLEFEAGEWQPQHVLTGADGRPLWLYQAPFLPSHRASTSRS